MTHHPGRLALLTQAAHGTMTDEQRIRHIRIVFGKDADEKAILAELTKARTLHLDRKSGEAAAIIESMINAPTRTNTDVEVRE